MKGKNMKRSVAAMLCAAMLTTALGSGASAEAYVQAIEPEQTATTEQSVKKFTLKPEYVDNVLCVSVVGASSIPVKVRLYDEKEQNLLGSVTVKTGTGTAFFSELVLNPGKYVLRAAYEDEEAAKAVKAVRLEYELVDPAAEQAAAEEAARQAAGQAAAEEAARLAAEQAAAEEAAR